MKIRTINIILIIAVILFAYLWISKPTHVQDNSMHQIDSLKLILSQSKDSMHIISKERDSVKAVNLKYFLQIRELSKDKSDLLTEYEKMKGHVIHASLSEDMKIFKSYTK